MLILPGILHQEDWYTKTDLEGDVLVAVSLAQAELGAIAREELSKTKAAEIARANRQNKSRWSIQKGGLLYADGARAMTRKRQGDDAEAKKLPPTDQQLENHELFV